MRIITEATATAAYYKAILASMRKNLRPEPNTEDIAAGVGERQRIRKLIPKKRKFK